MKKALKYFTVFCTAAICILAVSVTANAVNTETKYLRGDADGEGIVSISDVTTIQRHLADLKQLSGADLHAADVGCDGLDITDATKIQRYLAEFEDSYHIGEWVNGENAQPTTYWIKPGNNELPFIQD